MTVYSHFMKVLITGCLSGFAQISGGFSQTIPDLTNPCINTAISGTIPDNFKAGDNLYSPSNPSDVLTAEIATDAIILRLIMEALGVQREIGLYPFDVENACAAVINNTGTRVIYFNERWLTKYTNDNFWGKVGIFAHELGHHINNHNLEVSTTVAIERELEADIFAGSAVALLGGTLKDAQSFLGKQPRTGSKTHPRKVSRLAAVAEGFELTSLIRERVKYFSTNPSVEPAPAEVVVDISDKPGKPEEPATESAKQPYLGAVSKGLHNILRGEGGRIAVVDREFFESKKIDLVDSKYISNPVSLYAPKIDPKSGISDGGLSNLLIDVKLNYLSKFVREFGVGFYIDDNNYKLMAPELENVDIGYIDQVDLGIDDIVRCSSQLKRYREFLITFAEFRLLYSSLVKRMLGSKKSFAGLDEGVWLDGENSETEFLFEHSDTFKQKSINIDLVLKEPDLVNMESLFTEILPHLNYSWLSRIRSFLELVLEYKSLNLSSINSLANKKDLWSSKPSQVVLNPFHCSPNKHTPDVKFKFGTHILESNFNVESENDISDVHFQIFTFWHRREVAGTSERAEQSIRRVLAAMKSL